jgi:hypothetical protein
MTEWRDVIGYEGRYQVSDDGLVKSLGRQIVNCNGRITPLAGRILRRTEWSNGYWYVTIYKDCERRKFAVHVLVAEAFHGPKPSPTHQVRHLNGDRLDPRAINLAWGTASENAASRSDEKHGPNI